MNECIQCDQSQLTDDHKGEKVSIEEAPQDWLVPCFHADHRSDQVNKGDGLEGDETQGIKSVLFPHCVEAKAGCYYIWV